MTENSSQSVVLNDSHLWLHTVCVSTPYVDSGLSHLTGFGQWYVSKHYTRIDFKNTLNIESCLLLLLETLPLLHREAWTSLAQTGPRHQGYRWGHLNHPAQLKFPDDGSSFRDLRPDLQWAAQLVVSMAHPQSCEQMKPLHLGCYVAIDDWWSQCSLMFP